MNKINCLNPIAKVGLSGFDDNYQMVENFADADAVLVRSASVHELELGKDLLCIARAGAGYNNIPTDKCAENGIVVFNTPGANANGVKELVIAGILLSCRDIVGGIKWAIENKNDPTIAKTTEKAKKAFAGIEIQGKKVGVIGLGAIGVIVANALCSLGMEVYGCDPYLSVENALKLSRNVKLVKSNDEIYSTCDFITVHIPLMDATKKMVNAKAFELMKDGATLLNFSRDLLVDEEALTLAQETKTIKYITDFPNPTSANMKNAIVIPHLGASTEESEDNCAIMAVKEIRNYIENGNIVNSVNYPNVDAGICKTAGRYTLCHKNVPNMLSQFTAILAKDNINIIDMTSKSRGEYAYSILDVDKTSQIVLENLAAINDVFKARLVK